MEALVVLFGLGVIVYLAVTVFRRASRPPPEIRLDQTPPPPAPAPPAPAPPASIGEAAPSPPPPAPFSERTAHPAPSGQILSGRAYVVDGDTLFGIDAPEMNHPFGKRAKWAMFELCKNQIVTAEVTSIDDHGRTVAICSLSDGRDLSAELVKQGLALDWPKYSGGLYRALETPDARRKLWLADARQKGWMHLWDKFDAQQEAKAAR
ncbi:thermonuclease family protein [Gymnodinialimonas ceratoperidinii]|uniref:Thermonuclease family protein n=1 Tax=Gymnodinialimonas ceratoperidinii TaxID=2856823 RepID=A0A8F6TX26_9RHOB|nr:thermonuclease family protein [Gymnodinialimonas ceratoperidinii]QXT39509.1 thermonuclease family protein [Gymnodinialimonas ceratoperidinii]